jgi:hypothetical protein
MQIKIIHIVSFDNPYPPNYGGIIDVFYKIKALHLLGYEIYLHCFVTKKTECSHELEVLTKEVYFYKYSKNPFLQFSTIPFSVVCRNNDQLLTNIKKVNAPILFEGLKTTFLVNNNELKDYTKILRLHNIEQDYFKGLSVSEKSLLQKMIYYFESFKYKNYENVMSKFDKIITLSKYENNYIYKKFGNSVYIPVFHGNENVLPLKSLGSFTLYHGDLQTADNKKAVLFLVSVFKELPNLKLIIASETNENFVNKVIGNQQNVTFVKIKNFEHLQELLQQAHINISWSFQRSGTKLKVINSLFNSRFSIINENIIDDDVVSDLCISVFNKELLIDKIKELENAPFDDFAKRKKILEMYLNDLKNAALIDKLFS